MFLNIFISRIKGFSLIELMVVIAIVALLSAVAIPAYGNYVKKSKVLEAANMISMLRGSFIEYYNAKGVIPTTLSDFTSMTFPVGNVASAFYTNGSFFVQLNSTVMTSPCVPLWWTDMNVSGPTITSTCRRHNQGIPACAAELLEITPAAWGCT